MLEEARTSSRPRGSLIAPCMNVVWADEDGNCGIQWAGRVPVRAQGSDGIVPMPAWTGVHDWGGFFPFEELPSVTNPKEGFSVACRGRPGGPDYSVFISSYWENDGRTRRVRDLLAKTSDHSKESFQALHADTVSPLAAEMVPIILNAIAAKGRTDQSEREAARISAHGISK